MRFLMHSTHGGRQLAVLYHGRVIDMASVETVGAESLPHDMLQLVTVGADDLESIRRRVAAAHDDPTARFPHLSEVTLLPPLDPPRGNVLAIGRNYQEHAEESARTHNETFTRPTVFTKAQTSIAGPHDDIRIDPEVTAKFDAEVELGVVLGRGGKNIRRENALEHVFGYLVLNDFSARDIQYNWGGQFFKGKSLDGSCPIGPWIVSADEIPDPQNLALRLRVNGRITQEDNTRNMILPVSELIAQLSIGMTLPPGTVIATGTPAGVGDARVPPEYLQHGDVVESEIDLIGSLRNRIVSAHG